MADQFAYQAPTSDWSLEGPRTGRGARAYLFLRTNEGPVTQIKKPLIIGGPFPGIFDPEGLNGINRSFFEAFVNPLRAYGYDVVYIRYFDSVELSNSMNQSAFAIVNGIATVLERMAESGSKERLAVAGISMGGLAARAALLYIEKGMADNITDHRTRIFISLDAPQQGAVLPASLLELIRLLFLLSWLGEILNIEPIKPIHRLIHQTLTKELIPFEFVTTGSGGVSTPSELHRQFFGRLWSLGGYPTKLDARIALSNGSNSGKRLAAPGDDALRFVFCKAFEMGIQLALRYENDMAPMDVLNLTAYRLGSVSRVQGSEAWSVAPGGHSDFIHRVWEKLPAFLKDESYMAAGGNHCFIPTISALDDVEATSLYHLPSVANSNFDDYWADDANTGHCAISGPMKDYIIAALTTNKYPGPSKAPRPPKFRWGCAAEWNLTAPTFISVRNNGGKILKSWIKNPITFDVEVPALAPGATSRPVDSGPLFFRSAEFWIDGVWVGTMGVLRAWPCNQTVSYSEQGGGYIVAREWNITGKQYWRLPPALDRPGGRRLRLINLWGEDVVAWIKLSGENKDIAIAPGGSAIYEVRDGWRGEIEFRLKADNWYIGSVGNQTPNRNVTVYGAPWKASSMDGPFMAVASM
jgi:hypothetical protein